jgi:septum formation protein
MHLVLASASPRRAELLSSAGFAYEVAPANVDESVHPGEAPTDYAVRVAHDKARKAVSTTMRHHPLGVVLAADTVVAVETEILGKPKDRTDATRMLRLLSDRIHEVHTAVVVRQGEAEQSELVTTRVHFLPLSDAEIAWYVGSGEPDGKAGGYAIQGRGARFIDWIEGSWSNVVGLPIATVYRLLGRL